MSGFGQTCRVSACSAFVDYRGKGPQDLEVQPGRKGVETSHNHSSYNDDSNSDRHSLGLYYRTTKVTNVEAWLVLRAQSGDREALETLLETVQRPLHQYVVQLIGNRASADDVLQETLVRMYRKL
jgi:hypothetical protein